MATWIVGDVHGCFRSFLALLKKCSFKPGQDRLVLVGDLVNGGPDSLNMLRWLVDHQDQVECTLGNHDLYLLGRWVRACKKKKRDTLDPLLSAPDRETLLEWVRQRPLLIQEEQFRVVHAGLLPAWTWPDACKLAGQIETQLRGNEFQSFMANYYGIRRDRPEQRSEPIDQLCGALQILTMIRSVSKGGLLCSKFSGPPEDSPAGFRPWYKYPKRWSGTPIFFGHWAAAGYRKTEHVVALDSGCVWGNRLTAVRQEDGALKQQRSLEG